MLTADEKKYVLDAITAAEKGAATLAQLAKAHALCEKVEANTSIGMIRDHIRRMTPAPVGHSEAKSIVLGMVSGLLTWSILHYFNKPPATLAAAIEEENET